MKKRKLFVALLASLCVSAGAAGLAACNNKDVHDPILYEAYQSYAESTDNPLSYEDWVKELVAKLTEKNEGIIPEIGENGNWWIGDIDTGVKADGTWADPPDDEQDDYDITIVEYNGKLYYQFTYPDGRTILLPVDGEGEIIESHSFTVTAIDQNGNPVSDFYFYLGYSENYVPHYLKDDGTFTTDNDESPTSLAQLFTTDETGIVTYYAFDIEDGLDYGVYEADGGVLGKNPLPDGYNFSFEADPVTGLTKDHASFVKSANGNYSVTLNFVLSNGWNARYDSSNDLKYLRYIPDFGNPTSIKEEYTPYVKQAENGRYNYFTLSPYVAPESDDNMPDSEYSQYLAQANAAASGVYKLSWTASKASAKVSLYAYDFFGGRYNFRNSDGTPAESHVTSHSGTAPTDAATLQGLFEAQNDVSDYATWLAEYNAKFTGGNYVTIEVNVDQASARYCLGFVTDTDCDVTITVERIGDVTQWTDVTVSAPVPSDLTKIDDNDGRLLDVPFTSSIVYNESDGYYHIGELDGPIVYAQLNNPTRANENSMVFLSDYSVEESDHNTVFIYTVTEFDEATNTGVRTHTNYSELIQAYGAYANEKGLYPVNKTLQYILEKFCIGFDGWEDYDQYWLAACYYYGPVSDGTEGAPYDLTVGSNDITLSDGSAYVAFRTSTAGYYGFSSDGNISGIAGGIEIDGVTYVEVPALEDFKFVVSSSGSTVNVRVTSIITGTTSHIRYYETIDASHNNETVYHGTESSPLSATCGNEVAVYLVTVDKDTYAYDQALVVDLRTVTSGMRGNYIITVYGSTSATVKDANGRSVVGQSIYVDNGNPPRLYIDDTVDGTFFIRIEKVS